MNERVATAKIAGSEILDQSLFNKYFPPYYKCIEQFLPALIRTDAERLQFKSDGDKNGITSQLRHTREWEQGFSGLVFVWEALDGTLYIADGHQRLGLACRLQAQSDGSPIYLSGYRFREADGWSVEKMRVYAAANNITQGGESTKPLDVAKLLRNGGPSALLDLYVSPQRICYRDGKFLAALCDDAFRLILNRVAPETWGIAVGELVPDPRQQLAVFDFLKKQKPKADLIRDLVIEAMDSGFADRRQTDIFGVVDLAHALIVERVAIFSACRDSLKGTIAGLEGALRIQDEFAKCGSALNLPGVNEQLQLRRVMLTLLPQARLRGEPLSLQLTAAAEVFQRRGKNEKENAVAMVFNVLETESRSYIVKKPARSKPTAVDGGDGQACLLPLNYCGGLQGDLAL